MIMKIWYKLNPCDFERHWTLDPLTRIFTALTYGTDCKCCLGFRIAAALALGYAIGRYA